MKRTGIALAVVALGLWAGCKKDGAEAQGEGGAGGAKPGAVAGKAVDHVAQFAHVPSGAQAVLTFDLSTLWDDAIDHNFGIAPVKKDPGAVREALSAASNKSLGFDITAAKTVVVWAAFNPDRGPTFAAHFGGLSGKLPGEVVKTHEGVDIVRLAEGLGAMVDSGLLMGTEDALMEAIAVSKGKSDSLAKSGADAHKALLDSAGEGAMTLTVSLGELAKLAPPPLNGFSGVGVVVSTSGAFSMVAKGEKATLDLVMAQYEQGVAMAKKELTDVYADAVRESSPLLLPLTYAVEKWDDFVAVGKPIRKDDAIVTKMELGSAGIWLPATGVLAAVAIPAFVKYMRRAKTTEAIDMLDRMYKGAAVYYSTPFVDRATGSKVACQFPKSVSLTPALKGGQHPCCDGSDDRCAPKMDLWDADTWSALNFQVPSDHYYIYEFKSVGVGADARFTATAYGDLDCDGVFSTFERYGYGDPTAGAGECFMKGSSAFYKDKETE